MDYILILVLIISFLTDLDARRILNIVTIPAMILGISYHLITAGWSGFVFSMEGLLLGLGLLLIPFLLGGMGAGDVKLLAAIGAIKGPAFVFQAFIFTAIIGGLISLILILRKYNLRELPRQIYVSLTFLRSENGSYKPSSSGRSFPYGAAIVLGTFCTYFWGRF
ncbi:MAG: prepilin peptidase [Bacillaceae bacterium]|nr:prepilin peptidase [Bacillaceae bacterium]